MALIEPEVSRFGRAIGFRVRSIVRSELESSLFELGLVPSWSGNGGIARIDGLFWKQEIVFWRRDAVPDEGSAGGYEGIVGAK